MASQQKMEELKTLIGSLASLESGKLLRPDLGVESLKSDLEPLIEQIKHKTDFASEFAPYVHDTHLAQFIGPLNQIFTAMQQQIARGNPEYISQKKQFVQFIRERLEEIKLHWFPFVAAAVEARGFLQDEGIRKEYQQTIENMRNMADNTVKNVKGETDKMLEEARKMAQQIEERARRTAAHISVVDAQKQFEEAQKDGKKRVTFWSILSAIVIVIFILAALYFMNVQLPEKWTWHVVYFTAIRITILTAIGAVATFFLRILRANMHILQHNLHRQRVANSMAAFVESAITPEQRDLILTHLVDAIATFGCSGLIQTEEDSIYSPKMMIDNITRTITSSGKGS